MAWCLQKGISRLTVDYDAKITNAGIKEFCFGGADPGGDRRELRVCQLMPFSEAFLDELIEVCPFLVPYLPSPTNSNNIQENCLAAEQVMRSPGTHVRPRQHRVDRARSSQVQRVRHNGGEVNFSLYFSSVMLAQFRRRSVIHDFRFPNRFCVRYTGSWYAFYLSVVSRNVSAAPQPWNSGVVAATDACPAGQPTPSQSFNRHLVSVILFVSVNCLVILDV